MRDRLYKRHFTTSQQRNLALLLRNIVVDDCSNDDLYFIIHLLLYGTKIILVDTDLTEISDMSTEQNIIKEVAIYHEKLQNREQSQIHDHLHILKTLLFQPHKIVPNMGCFEVVNLQDSQELCINQNVISSDSIQPSIWKLHPKERRRLLSEFYLDRELVIESCIYVSVLCGRYDVNRARTVSFYAQVLELSAYQLSSIESLVFRRLHEKGIEIQLQGCGTPPVRKSDERSEIISALGDSIHENILWEGDESEFILINSDSDMSFSDTSSVIIRRRKNIVPPKNNQKITHLSSGESNQQHETEKKEQGEISNNNMTHSRYRSSIASLWESDSEIITKLQDGSGGSYLQKPQDAIQSKNVFHVKTPSKQSSSHSSSSDKISETFDDDETDLFER